jgi:hypothetical protein
MRTLLFIAFLYSFNAHAFTLNNGSKLVFDKDDVTVNVARGCTNIGITDEELFALIGPAIDNYWNTSPSSRLKLKKGSLVNVSSDFHDDNICKTGTNCTPNPDLAVSSGILVTCNDNISNFTNTGILGITVPNNISGTTIVGSLVMINDQTGTGFESKTRDEKIAVIAHEIGHAFGLGHSPVQDSLMYYATVTQRRSLGRDDIDGITYLYPKQQPVSCGTVDFNPENKKGPNFWSGLFIGFSIIALAEIARKKKAKNYT